jgi:colicin import membrane protein
MRRFAGALVLALSLSLVGCDDSAKKAEEAKVAAEAAAAKAKAEAEAAAAKAKAEAEKAAAEAKAKMEADKEALTKTLTDGLAEADKKVEELKAKVAKLKGPAKKKGEEAVAAYDAAKKALTDAQATLAGMADPAGFAELSGKLTGLLDEAKKAAAGVEEALAPPAKKKK